MSTGPKFTKTSDFWTEIPDIATFKSWTHFYYQIITLLMNSRTVTVIIFNVLFTGTLLQGTFVRTWQYHGPVTHQKDWINWKRSHTCKATLKHSGVPSKHFSGNYWFFVDHTIPISMSSNIRHCKFCFGVRERERERKREKKSCVVEVSENQSRGTFYDVMGQMTNWYFL